MSRAAFLLRMLGTAVLCIYLVGAIYWVVNIAIDLIHGRGLPQGEWWQLAFVPLAMGVIVLVAEGIGTFMGNGFAFNAHASPFRRGLGQAAAVLLVIAVVIGWPMYRIAHS